MLGIGLILFSVPLVIDSRFSLRDDHYNKLVLDHERVQDESRADFDGDGTPGTLMIDRKTAPPQASYPGIQAWIVVIDSGRELLRLPYRYGDSTLRTHVAIREEAGRSRFLVFDHTAQGAPTRQVFVWNGNSMTEIEPSLSDQEILSALGARDDAGSWNDWALYRSLRVPALFLYYLVLLVSLGAWLTIRHRRNSLLKT